MSFASDKLSRLRRQAGLTQDDMAQRIDMTHGAISHYERGLRTPSVFTVRKILTVLKKCGVRKPNGQDYELDDLFPA